MTSPTRTTAPVRAATALGVLAVAGLCLSLVAQREPLPRGVVTETEPLAPRDALASILVQPGFRVRLAAAEPMIQAPVCMNFDGAGRLIVLEMRSYMPDALGTREKTPSSRVVILEDNNRDGKFDKATTFLDGLVLPRSVAPCRDGVLVLAPPDVLFCRDTNGDGRADERRVLLSGLDGLSNPEHAPNALTYGIDNWWHLSQCNVEFRFDGETVVTRPTAAHGQWGMTMDDDGLLYYTPNSSALLGDLVPKHAAKLNPRQRGFAGVNELICADTATWPRHPTPGVNRGYMENVLRADGTLAALTAACGPSCNRAGGLGEELRSDFFICEAAGNLVKRLERDDASATPKAHNAYTGSEFLASTDERFRPVWTTIGPEGALYIADMYRGVIQHRTYMTPYLRAQVIERGLEAPLDFGRIYRVTTPATPPPPRVKPASMTDDALVPLLAHPDGWWRDTAQRLLVERRAVATVPAVRALLKSENPLARLHALWTLEGLGAVTDDEAALALNDPRAALVRAALRIIESGAVTPPRTDEILALTASKDVTVAAQAVLALRAHAEGSIAPRIAAVLGASAERRPVRSACIAIGAGVELETIGSLAQLPPSDALKATIGELADCVLAGGAEERGLLAAVTARALRDGDWTGAPLLARWRGATRVDTSTPRVLSVHAEPSGFASLSKERADVAEVLRMLEWPGHEATGAPPKPRDPTPQERARFTRGEQLYHNCVACHMKDGKGTPGQVPPLSGSSRVLGPPEPLIRVLLHGLDGTLETGGLTYRGQMPATTITGDDDLASILTFVRGSFGNTASPVHPDDVTRVREATRDRRRAWTQQELEALK